MRKNNLLLVALAATALLCSCGSPKVMTNVLKVYPQPLTADSVMVFLPGELIPNSADPLGNVAVVDAGNSSKCNYDQVLQLAKEETAKIGGNGLAISEHLKPSVWGSSCHQIMGTMLYLKDLNVYLDDPNPVMEAMAANAQNMEVERKKRQAPESTFSASIGYGIITSKYYLDNELIKNKGGLDWRLEYERIYKNGLGFSILYSGFKADFPENFTLNLSYFAGSFIGKYRFANDWIVKYGVGMGYFYSSNNGYGIKGTGGFGLHTDLGLEYMVSRNVGIGVSMSAISASLSNGDIKLADDERYGIGRINFMTGVRFYF